MAQAYFDLRQFDMQLDIAKRTLQAWEESVSIAQARLRQGVIKRLDLDQFEAERENAAARIAELKRQMVQKENEIAVLRTSCRYLTLSGQGFQPATSTTRPRPRCAFLWFRSIELSAAVGLTNPW